MIAMVLLQPVPPVPPLPPDFSQVVIAPGGPPEWVPFLAVFSMLVSAVVIWPLIRAAARRIEGKGVDATALRAEIEQLHDRLADVEQLQQRVFDLENRLEFSERLLTQHREALLQRPEGGA